MIFVTGGTGLVGSHLLLALLEKGEKVRALKRPKSNIGQVHKTFGWYTSEAEKLYSRIEWVDGDILDIYSLEPVLEGVNTIYHCAAIVSFDPRERKNMIANNVEGTANLINAAILKGIKHFCHVSSVSALGKTSNGEAITEETNWIPSRKNTGYSQSKFFSEAEVWRGIEEGLNAVIVNPSVIIGPGNWGSGSPAIFRVVARGLKFYTTGITGYIGVQDVVSAILLLMDEKNFEKTHNQRYLLSAENLSFKDFFTQVASALNVPPPSIKAGKLLLAIAWRLIALVSFFTGKQVQISRETTASATNVTLFDGSKITRQLGFIYKPLSTAIQQTAKIYRSSHL